MRECDRLNTTTASLEQSPFNLVEIGAGAQGRAILDLNSGAVRKEYWTSGEKTPGQTAKREYDMLARLHSRLRTERYLDCPKPLHVHPEGNCLQMTYCPGERLDHLLFRTGWSTLRELDHIAEQIVRVMNHYHQEFNQPYYSMRLHNMLFDHESKVLSVLDLYSSLASHEPNDSYPVLETSLGRFIGKALSDTVREKTAWKLGYASVTVSLLARVLERVRADQLLDRACLADISNDTFRGYSSVGNVRSLWFATVGRGLYGLRMRSLLRGVG